MICVRLCTAHFLRVLVDPDSYFAIHPDDSSPKRFLKICALRIAGTGTVLLLFLVGMLCIMAVIYQSIDPIPGTELTYTTSLYFIFETITTVGYGDFPPRTTGGRIYIAFVAFLGLPLFYSTILHSGCILLETTSRLFRGLFRKIPLCRWKIFHKFNESSSSATSYLVIYIFSVVLMLFWASVYVAIESWSFGDSLYWSIVTGLSIGYGDFSPKTQTGQGIWVLVALTLVPFNSLLIGMLCKTISERLALIHNTAHSQLSRCDAELEENVVGSSLTNQDVLNIVRHRMTHDNEFAKAVVDLSSDAP